jgi:protein SCO1/2
VRAMLVLLVLAALLLSPGQATGTFTADGNLSDFAFQPHPGARLPLDAGLIDEHGRAVPFRHFFAGKPVMLVLEYLRCKTLCGLTLANVVAGLDALPLDAGRDFQVVAISIDPRDSPADAAAAKLKYLAGYRHSGADDGWHFLTGREQALQEVAKAVGFTYRYDAELDQYLHPAGFVVAAPDGSISRYVLDLGMKPADLQAALADAAQARALDPLTRILLLCHFGGAPLGRYTVPIEAAFALANIAGIIALISVFVAIRRRRHG